MDSLVVTVEAVKFQNEKNGFIIFYGLDFNTGKYVNVKGYGYNIVEDNLLECKGYWKSTNKYGSQFDAKEIGIYTPTIGDKILKYLESGYIRGIGKVTANRIFDMFGDKSLEILDNNPEELKKVSGIGEKTLGKIINDWNDKRISQKQNEDIQELGFTFDESLKLLRLLGDEALRMIINNPYSLLFLDDFKINFDKIDEIARKHLRYELTNEIRVLSYIMYAIKENEQNGHTYIEEQELIKKAAKKLRVNTELIDLLCEAGVLKEYIKRENINEMYILQDFETYKIERSVAIKLNNLINGRKKIVSSIDKKIESFETKDFKLSSEQKSAIKESFEHNVNIINGGPGVGKTTALDILVKIIKKEGYSYTLCAYTGKASQRMKESTGEDANTIHRTLEYNPQDSVFNRNQQNPLESDFIIVDEASMIDLFLFNELLKAIVSGATLIIIGDVDQIPSISAGCILRDMIDSEKINVSRIKKLQRQAENSKIIKNAYKVNDGLSIEYENEKGDDFYFIKTSNDRVTLDKIKQMVSVNIPKAFKLNPKDELQLLTPNHEKILGRKNLNNELQEILNPSKENKNFVKRGEIEFREGDNIIQTKNNYETNVMNGDCGVIEKVQQNSFEALFPEDLIEYKKDTFDQIELSYAITMHKSQGSEYQMIIIPISHNYSRIMDRSLLYTAMTRGKKIVVMIGSPTQLERIIKNDYSRNRKTFLKERLSEIIE